LVKTKEQYIKKFFNGRMPASLNENRAYLRISGDVNKKAILFMDISSDR